MHETKSGMGAGYCIPNPVTDRMVPGDQTIMTGTNIETNSNYQSQLELEYTVCLLYEHTIFL